MITCHTGSNKAPEAHNIDDDDDANDEMVYQIKPERKVNAGKFAVMSLKQ